MSGKIWVDDLRPAPSDEWVVAKTSLMAINMLISHKVLGIPVTVLSLDHDLGGDDTTRPVMLWMIEANYWPKAVLVHTANPVGREWLMGMLVQYYGKDVHA